MKNKILGAFFLLPSLVIGSANASAILDSANLAGSATTIDFNQFVGNEQNGINSFTFGEVNVSTTQDPKDLWLTNTAWDLGDNGEWNSDRNGFLGIRPSTPLNMYPVKIEFGGGNISGFGFLMNYLTQTNTDNGIISVSAYDSGATLLEEFIINTAGSSSVINTAGGLNSGAFRGIQRDIADIAYIQLVGFNAVFDDLQFTRASTVSEPASLALLMLGLAGIGYSGRKKQASQQ